MRRGQASSTQPRRLRIQSKAHRAKTLLLNSGEVLADPLKATAVFLRRELRQMAQ